MRNRERRSWGGRLLAGIVVLSALALVDLLAAPASPQSFTGGVWEASGVEQVEGTNGVLFVDDDRTHEVFFAEFAPDGSQRGPVVTVTLPGVELTDPEGMTSHDGWYYVVGSQSKGRGFEGDGLIRFHFDPATRQVSDIQRIQGVKRWLAAAVPELRGTEQRVGDEVLNIEAIAWDPHADRLLLGLRTPVVNGAALVVPLEFRDVNAPMSVESLTVNGAGTLHVPLGGSGIRSLEYDDRRDTFHIITGSAVNDEARDFRLVEWNGEEGSGSRVREVSRFSRTLKPEGVTGGSLHGQPADVIVFDTSRFLLWPGPAKD